MTEIATAMRSRLIACFAAVFPSLEPTEILTLSCANYDQWDSLASIALVAVIEEEFDLVLTDEAVAGMTSFAAAEATAALR